jgi:hypothetical protein
MIDDANGFGAVDPGAVDDLEAAADEGRQALREHIVDKAMAARLKHGLYIDGEAILDIVEDRGIVRHPAAVRFDAGPLRPGEFACVLPVGDEPQDGYGIFVHPAYRNQPDIWPLLIAYYIPVINYGQIVTSDDAELFGATLLGLEVDEYYGALCELADALVSAPPCSE